MKRVNKRPVDHFEGKWEKGKKYTLYALVKNNGTLFRSLTPKEKDEPYVIYDSTNETFSANPGWEIVEMSEDSRLSAMGGNGGGASGQDGKDAGFGTISASVANTSGNPSVAVETSGPDTAKNIFFKFFGLKGNQGIPGVNNADIKVVDALPAASAQTTGRIYLVETETANIYARWYTEVDGSTYAWRQLGTTEVALEDYATKDNLSQLRQEVTDDVSQLEAKVNPLDDAVSPLIEGSLGEWKKNAETTSSSATIGFTGRGLAIAENKTLYKVYVRIGQRTTSSPITQVKLTLRKDSRTGDVLATKTVSFSESDTGYYNVEFDFSDSPVSYSGVIYCTMQGNAEMKFATIAASAYAFSANASYCVSTDLSTDVIFTQSSNNNTIPGIGYIDELVYALKIGNEQLEDNSVGSDQIAPGSVTPEKLAGDLKNNEVGVAVILPKDIYAVPGSSLQIFYRGIISAFDPYAYNVEVSVYNSQTGITAGYAYPRYYQIDATTSNVGDYSVTINVRRNDNSIIASGTSTLHIISVPASPSSQKNILAFGASVLSYGFIVKELERRLTTDTGDGIPSNPTGINLSNIAFVGRKTGSIETSVHQEATGGISWADYATIGTNRYRFYIEEGGDTIVLNETFTYSGITFKVREKNITAGAGNISCSFTGSGVVPASGTLPLASGNVDYTSWILENTSPFYNANTGQIDFANYSSLYCGGATINILLSHCGVNDMAGATWDLDAIVANIKTIARAYHTYNPSGKFVISTIAVPDPTGGFGYNYHADGAVSNYYTIVRRFFQFAQAVEDLAGDAEFSGYVVHSPVMPECDGEWMYPKYDMQVNNRNTTKEKVGANAYHPSTSNPFGYYMIADAIYQTLCAVI